MKKGFTLVELIAVIIVLGIIAALTTPIITGIIDDSTKSTESASAKNYVETLDKSLLEGALNRPRTGDYEVNVSELAEWANENVTGDLPVSGKVLISDNNVVSAQLQMENFQIICFKSECEAIEEFGDYAYYSGDKANITNALRASLKRPDNEEPYLKYRIQNKQTGELKNEVPDVCLYISDRELCINVNSFEQSKTDTIEFFNGIVGLTRTGQTDSWTVNDPSGQSTGGCSGEVTDGIDQYGCKIVTQKYYNSIATQIGRNLGATIVSHYRQCYVVNRSLIDSDSSLSQYLEATDADMLYFCADSKL